MPTLTIQSAEPASRGIRADLYIASLPGGPNRSKLKSGIRELTINGKNARLSTRVRPGDAVAVSWDEAPAPNPWLPENIPLDILHEDTDVTVVNKSPGMVTHPGAGNWSGTLVNALLYHWGDESRTAEEAAARNGIVHRLDKDTSGVIIAARNASAEAWLQRQFFERRVKKEYIAIAYGRPPEAAGTIRTYLARDPRDRKRFSVPPSPPPRPGAPPPAAPPGKLAVTVYRCVGCYGPFSLFRLQLKTGRTHQIRVHLRHIGCPVLGDPLYGPRSTPEWLDGTTLMLHSRLLALRLPGAEEFSEFRAPVPERFTRVLDLLRGHYEKCQLP